MTSSERTSDRRAGTVRGGFWRRPGFVGVAILVAGVPLIHVVPRDAAILFALVALCLYPFLDVPRILARPSWWRGAIVSALVWFVVFATLAGIVDSIHDPGDDALVFRFPFLIYPLVLAISGFVRLEGRYRGRPPESGPRIAAIASIVVCALLVVVPIVLGMIPVLTEKITGNTVRNIVYSFDGEVLSISPGHLTVRVNAGITKSFSLVPETQFDFRGPAWRTNTSPAGPDLLKPGQPIAVGYIYRNHQAQAQSVNIWVDRKGCAGDAKWTAAIQTPPSSSPPAPSLAGTAWESWLGSRDAPGQQRETFEFLDKNRVAYQDALWRQNGSVVLIEVNDCYALYEGRIDGDEITGEFWNEMGVRTSWTARRKQASATAPK
jgi:hypothetical protein